MGIFLHFCFFLSTGFIFSAHCFLPLGVSVIKRGRHSFSPVIVLKILTRDYGFSGLGPVTMLRLATITSGGGWTDELGVEEAVWGLAHLGLGSMPMGRIARIALHTPLLEAWLWRNTSWRKEWFSVDQEAKYPLQHRCVIQASLKSFWLSSVYACVWLIQYGRQVNDAPLAFWAELVCVQSTRKTPGCVIQSQLGESV